MKIPTFVDVLNQANAWRTSNTPEALEKAQKMLEDGMSQFDDALPLGDELVLVLKRQSKLDEAITQLKTLEKRFKHIGEETLCRWGAVYKQRATQQLACGNLSPADEDYRNSEKYYSRAYEEHHTFYPRINELTVRFVRAGLAKEAHQHNESAVLLRDVETKAAAMLVDPNVWAQRKTDDAIWKAATQGEACLLLRHFDVAARAYSEAMRLADRKEFYRVCMRDQVRDELLPTFERLSLAFEGPLANPDTFFGISSSQ